LIEFALLQRGAVAHAEQKEQVADSRTECCAQVRAQRDRHPQIGERGPEMKAQRAPVESQRIGERPRAGLLPEPREQFGPLIRVRHSITVPART